MSDPTMIIAITSISAVSIGILSKLLYHLRNNIKSCYGIVFRSPTTSRQSPRANNIIELKEHLENTLPKVTVEKQSPNIFLNPSYELDKQIRLRELELQLRRDNILTIKPEVLNDITSNGRVLI